MRPIVTDRVAYSLSVGLSHVVSPAKTAEQIKMPFGLRTGQPGGPEEPYIRWRSKSPMGRGNFEAGKGRPIVKYREYRRPCAAAMRSVVKFL